MLADIVEIEDPRTVMGEKIFEGYDPLRNFRGNYGVPRKNNNTVIKGFFYVSEEISNKLIELHELYTDELNKFFPIQNSKAKRIKNTTYFEQVYISGKTYEQKPFEKEDFKIILNQTLNAIYNSNKTIGIDCKPENWIEENGNWKLIDTFPPFMITENNNFKEIFYLREYERNFADNPDKTYFRDPVKIARRLALKVEKLTKTDNTDIAIDILHNYSPKKAAILERLHYG